MEVQDSPTVADLIAAAVGGSQASWNALVEQYLPLVYSVIRTYRLSAEDAADVSQTTWLRPVEKLDTICEPRALPSWIVTTTKREALGTLAARQRTPPVDPAIAFEAGRVKGQLLPPHAGAVRIVAGSGVHAQTTTDSAGCFVLDQPSRGPVRLECTVGGRSVSTEWVPF